MAQKYILNQFNLFIRKYLNVWMKLFSKILNIKLSYKFKTLNLNSELRILFKINYNYMINDMIMHKIWNIHVYIYVMT